MNMKKKSLLKECTIVYYFLVTLFYIFIICAFLVKVNVNYQVKTLIEKKEHKTYGEINSLKANIGTYAIGQKVELESEMGVFEAIVIDANVNDIGLFDGDVVTYNLIVDDKQDLLNGKEYYIFQIHEEEKISLFKFIFNNLN